MSVSAVSVDPKAVALKSLALYELGVVLARQDALVNYLTRLADEGNDTVNEYRRVNAVQALITLNAIRADIADEIEVAI